MSFCNSGEANRRNFGNAKEHGRFGISAEKTTNDLGEGEGHTQHYYAHIFFFHFNPSFIFQLEMFSDESVRELSVKVKAKQDISSLLSFRTASLYYLFFLP